MSAYLWPYIYICSLGIFGSIYEPTVPAQHNFVFKTGYDKDFSFEYVKPREGFEVTNELNVYGDGWPPGFTFINESDKVIVRFSGATTCPIELGLAVGATFP